MRSWGIRVLMVERDHQITALQVLVDSGIVNDNNVELSVIVAIKESDSAASHRFKDIAPIRAGVWECGKASLRGDIAEMDTQVWHGGQTIVLRNWSGVG